jgi:hypothetical protein
VIAITTIKRKLSTPPRADLSREGALKATADA